MLSLRRGRHRPGAALAFWTLLTLAARDVEAAPPAPPRVALTFDDLPAHAALPPGLDRVAVARSVIAALQTHHAPAVYGFVNAKRVEDEPANGEVLRRWRAAGYPLGSHAFSHMDLDTNSAEAFEKDVIANEASLEQLMKGRDWHWFRFPYLHEGETAEKRSAVAAFLHGRGYRVAQVSMSFDDWAYNDPYARCAAAHDDASIGWMEQSYLRRAAQSISLSQEAARRLHGRDIAHVMLLHIGAFQTVMLPKLLDMLEGRGFRLVTLPEAQRDPAYAKPVALPAIADDALARLAVMCR